MARTPATPVALHGELKLERFYQILECGLFMAEACRALGIKRADVLRWREWGKEGRTGFVEFDRRVAEIEVDLLTDTVRSIRESKDWRAKAWFAERRFKGRWGTTAEGDEKYTAQQADEMRGKLQDRLRMLLERRDSAAGDS